MIQDLIIGFEYETIISDILRFENFLLWFFLDRNILEQMRMVIVCDKYENVSFVELDSTFNGNEINLKFICRRFFTF